MTISSTSTPFSLVRHVLCMLASGCIAPVVVQAACGDYLITGRESPVEVHGLVQGRIDREFLHSHRTPASPARPCEGPGCSAVPLRTPVSSLITLGVRLEQVGTIAAKTVIPTTLRNFDLPLNSTVAHFDPLHEIFHPPRVASRMRDVA